MLSAGELCLHEEEGDEDAARLDLVVLRCLLPVDLVLVDDVVQQDEAPGGSVRGERANLTGLVLDCIEAKFCK